MPENAQKTAPALALLATGVMLSACATNPSGSQGAYDPFEPMNRAVFAFNTQADKYVIGPASDVYRTITPKFFRTGVSNFLGNLGEPVTFANDLLQGKPARALDSASRFMINTTIGIGGVFDPATAIGIPEHDEDFGQTLAVWGLDTGPYLVLPLMGPTTLRDGFGRGVDSVIDPVNQVRLQADYLANDEEFDSNFRIATSVLGLLNARVALDAQLDQLYTQPEPYVALRDAYLGARAAAVRDGRRPDDPYADLPDFGDDDFGPDGFSDDSEDFSEESGQPEGEQPQE